MNMITRIQPDAGTPSDNPTGQKLAYVYFEDEPGWQSTAKLLSRDEARRIAVNIAKLPGLLQRG